MSEENKINYTRQRKFSVNLFRKEKKFSFTNFIQKALSTTRPSGKL